MSVPEQTPYKEYTANGVAKSFALGFICDSKNDLIVMVGEIEPPIASWSLGGGNVVFTTAPAAGQKITLQRNTPFGRTTDYQSFNNSFRPQAVNSDFDRVWWKIQELGVRDWLLDLKIQKFRDDVNLTALENTLEEAKQIRDDTADSVIEVQNNVSQSQTLLADTTAQANLAQGYTEGALAAKDATESIAANAQANVDAAQAAVGTTKNYVDTALSAFSGPATKFFPTVAAGNAAIASIGTGEAVWIGDAANGGLYEKFTASATSLSKSPYDPVELGKKTFINVFDTFAQLEASSLDRYAYAAVVSDTDHSKNGYYRKIEDYSWVRARLNSENEIRDFLSKKGFAQIQLSQPSNANYSTLDKTLTISGTAVVITNRGVYQLSTPIVLSFPENRVYSLVFNEDTRTLKLGIREDGWLFCGTINKVFDGLSTSVFSDYLVDGVQQPTVADVFALDTMKADLQTTSLTINLTDLTATIPSGAFAYTAKGRIAVPTQTVTGLAASGRTNFMLSKADQTVTAVGDSAANSLIVAKTHYLLFTYAASQQVAIGYTGVLNIVGGAPNLVAKPNYSLMLTKASTLNFDFNNNKIVVSGGLWIQYDGGRINVAAQEIALDPARNKGFAQILLVNPTNSTMYVKSQASPYTVPKDHLQVGAYYENDMIFFGLDHFSVNGNPFQKAASVRPSFGWDFNNKVDVDVSDSLTEADPLNMANLTTSIVYGWFDNLVADFPDYVTKTTLGNDATDTLPIHQYRFKPKLPNPQNAGLNVKIPKVMLLTIHNEGMNMVALHVMMREICRSWQNSESLESMRHGLEFVVIPVGNPWGLNNGKRTNSNQIDINRQFPADWVQLGVPGDYFYSGTAALSEAEAQHLYAAIVAEKPDVYFDVHSYGSWNKEGTSAWIAILNDKTTSAVISATTKVYAQYKKKYPWIVDIDKFIDVSNEKLLGGGTSSKSAASVGAVGGTFESAWNLKNAPDGEPRGHTPAINFSTDLLATCILQSIGVVISSK